MGNIRLQETLHAHPIAVDVQIWLDAKRAQGLTPRTLRGYHDHLKHFVLFLSSTDASVKGLDSVSAEHIRQWLLRVRRQVRSSHTVHGYYRSLRSFWNWCIREGLTENNPFVRVQAPKRERVLKRALTPQEVQRLLDACAGSDWKRARDRALVLLFLDTGLRLHEALALTTDVLSRDAIIIRGKGGKDRIAIISPAVRAALRRYLRLCPYARRDDPTLWYGQYGALTLDGLKEVVRNIGRRAEMRLGAHQLRRTFATWSLSDGMDIEHLRLLMGHSDYRTLQQYLSLREEDLKRAHAQHSPLKALNLDDFLRGR